MALVLLAAISICAATWIAHYGYTLYYGDAEAHLNIARRIVDSQTPGYDQIGTVWLPVPHVLMLPFVGRDAWWHNGLAGTIPGICCFVAGGMLLFGAARRLFGSGAAAYCSLLVLALNPNLLYLQSTPMTEHVFFLGLLGMLYCTVVFRSRQSLWAVAGAAAFSTVASLTRYEGWWLIPFVALYFLAAGGSRRFQAVLLFSLIAGLAPLYWLAHNWYYFGDALEFYRGPGSAKGIYQRALDAGLARYPGDHEWTKAVFYFGAAARLAVGVAVLLLGALGLGAALLKQVWWPVLFLLLGPVFYILSMYSSGVPIFVPHLWPHGYYNTRYGLAVLPLLALCTGALVSLAPARLRGAVLAAVVLTAILPWLAHPNPGAWICWKESQVNSVARRAWTHEAADYMRAHIRPGDTVFTSFGDLTGIFREAGIPIRRTTHDGNNPRWMAAIARPDLFLWDQWAVAIAGDSVSTALAKARKHAPNWQCVKMVAVKDAPVIEIYRRQASPPYPVP
ncbi:MAG TPA: glycosyltransferase family 39 protein [Bryobacteraceae bacterium]|nr:glycosyltransferase family 39 protein [Bryobacteraceae bacterium]